MIRLPIPMQIESALAWGEYRLFVNINVLQYLPSNEDTVALADAHQMCFPTTTNL